MKEIPKVLSFPYNKVNVFNGGYVKGYLFQGNGFLPEYFAASKYKAGSIAKTGGVMELIK